MKKMMCITAIITAFMLIMPLAVFGKGEKRESVIATGVIKNETITKSDTFKVLDTTTDKISEMSAEDYIFGVVAAEMPALYDTEALKAQAVAAYTYACYKRENGNKEYDITTDFATDQSFKTEEEARKGWGENADEYSEKIKKAIKSVNGEMIYYKNKPILAFYHAVSAGDTYSAKDVFGEEIAYLQSAPSNWDKEAYNYKKTIEISEDELSEKLMTLADKKENTPMLDDLKALNSGLVESIKVYGKKVKGSELRTALGLPSSNFLFEKQDGKYIFNCIGYGHGVGMSQRGADCMAKQGYTYKQILLHYYKGTVVK